jgi:hypothetical protein
MLNLLFIVNLASSLFLAGLIWTVQCVHYPIFHRLDIPNFTEHINFHRSAISLLVVPVMSIELGTSVWLAWSASTSVFLHQTGLAVVVLIWLTTFFIQVPLHQELSFERNENAIHRLVYTNWLRTFLWTVKATLSLIVLHNLLQ